MSVLQGMKIMMTVVMVMMVMSVVTKSPVAAGTIGRKGREPRQVSLSRLIGLLRRAASDDDSNVSQLDTAELGRMAGYNVDRHTVVTGDGYILTLHHIPPYGNPTRQPVLRPTANRHGGSQSQYTNMTREWPEEGVKNGDEKDEASQDDYDDYMEDEADHHTPNFEENPKVVFLQHGLMGSSDNWNTNTPENSLAYLLSDAGYDVWMGNFRGNVYSRRHVNMTHQNPEFWKFSYDEMAKHDLPAMLEHVLVETGVESVVYIGHSMGTTVFFASMSSLPEYYQDRIAAMIGLAPVATIKSISSPIKYLAPLVNDLYSFQNFLPFFGSAQDVMTNPLIRSFWDPYRVCSNQLLCENIQFLITGFDPSRADESMVPIILSHNPAGSSTQTLFHFAQGYASGRFQKFDFGPRKNVLHYGQEIPPEYDISKIKIPITLFWANNDWLTGEENINHLKMNLPNLEAVHKVSNPIFSHLDFLWATDARILVYEKIFDILDRFF